MLSGGRDSVCLLGIASALGAAAGALHVNYGLRGPESQADERLCRELCERLGVPLQVVAAPDPMRGGGNLHARARDFRYEAARELARRQGATVAAAHTASDQIETILYRLASSPGRRALLGMDPDRGWLVRPLLAAGATRDATASWCREHGLEWREDSANADVSFARTRVREVLLPAFAQVDPRAPEAILRTAELLRDEAAVLDAAVTEALQGRDRIPLDRLADLPTALARLVLRRLAEDATGGLCPRAANRLDDVLTLHDGALDLGDGARAEVREGVLTVTRTPSGGRR
jgi:tRNA(Ile)-lysidine synthase